VPGLLPTPQSRRGARFDNVKIAKASEVAADVRELEAITGYSLDDEGAFRRRLSHMVRHGQIDPKFARPRVARRPPLEPVGAASGGGCVDGGGDLPLGAGIREAIADALGGHWIEDIEVPASGGASVARRSLLFGLGDMSVMPRAVPPHFSRKGLVTVAGSSLFAELAVVRLFKLAGWTAYWRDGWGRGWVVDGDLERNHVKELPASLGSSVVASVAGRRGSLSGCWDVVAWKADLVAFAECKRCKRDKLTDAQGLWLRSALDIDLPNEAFVVVEWDLPTVIGIGGV
jgi:hypothetical protein